MVVCVPTHLDRSCSRHVIAESTMILLIPGHKKYRFFSTEPAPCHPAGSSLGVGAENGVIRVWHQNFFSKATKVDRLWTAMDRVRAVAR